MCILGEPTEQKLVLAHFGALWLRLTSPGRSSTPPSLGAPEGELDRAHARRARPRARVIAGVGGGDVVAGTCADRERRRDQGRLRLARLATPYRTDLFLDLRVPPDVEMAAARRKALELRGLEDVEAEVYVTAPGAELEESHPLVGALEEAHDEVFGSAPERDVTRWFSDAFVLSRYGIATVNYGTSSGLPDPEYGENSRSTASSRSPRVYARAAERICGEARHLRRGQGWACRRRGDRRPRRRRRASGSSGAGPTRQASACRSPGRGCAPIVPKKFFHTAGNFREHEEESKTVAWSHEIAPWIVFFQNVDAIVGPDEPVVYPEHLTEELDYELELAVVLKQAGKWFLPEEAMDYVGGYVIFNDITARDIQRREMRSGVFGFCKAIDTFCPLGPWIVTPDEIPDLHDLAMELRVNGESRQTSHSGNMSVTIPEILSHYSALGYSAGDVLDGNGERRRGLLGGRGLALPAPGRRDRGGDRADRRPPQPRRRLGPRHTAGPPRHASAGGFVLNQIQARTSRAAMRVGAPGQEKVLLQHKVGRGR